MHRQFRCVLGLLLGPLAVVAVAEPPDFGAAQRAGFQAQVSDLPQQEQRQAPYADQTPEELDGGNRMPGGNGPLNYYGGCDGSCDNSCDCTCGNGGCSCRNRQCGPPRGFWGRSEALYWWIRGSDAPPLLTTSPSTTPQNQAGILPNATVLFPTSKLNTEGQFGGRFTLGYWMDACETVGFQGNYFLLNNQNEGMSGSSNGTPILARPFFNTATQLEDAGLVAFPGLVSGRVSVQTSVRLMGAEANFRKAVYSDRFNRFDVLAGYRFLRFDDSIYMLADSNSLNPNGPIPVGTIFSTADIFGTKNQFHGGQVALSWQRNRGRWGFDALSKLGIGGIRQQVAIQGTTTVAVPNSPVVNETGGFFALGSNSGIHNRTVFSLIPELNTNLYYQLTPLWRINVGYTLLFVTNVVRASNQIDRRIDPAQFPPGVRGTFPAFAFNNSDLWVQGLSLGAECRF